MLRIKNMSKVLIIVLAFGYNLTAFDKIRDIFKNTKLQSTEDLIIDSIIATDGYSYENEDFSTQYKNFLGKTKTFTPVQFKAFADDSAIKTEKTDVDLQNFPNLAKFAERYGCTPNISEQAKNMYSYDTNGSAEIVTKGCDFGRLINTLRAERVIKAHDLNKIAVPNKCLHQDGTQFVTVAKKIHSGEGRRFSKEDVQDIITFVLETGYRDFSPSNIISNAENDKMTFVDLEDYSFMLGMVHGNEAEGIPLHCKWVYINCLGQEWYKYMEPDARDLFNSRYLALQGSEEGLKPQTPLYDNTKYDDRDINFQQVKEEYLKFVKTTNNK